MPISRSGWSMKTISTEPRRGRRVQAADGGDDGEQREVARRGVDVGRARDVALAPRLVELGGVGSKTFSPPSSLSLIAAAPAGRRASRSSRRLQKCRITGLASSSSRMAAGGDRRRADEGDHQLRHGAVDRAEREVVGEGGDARRARRARSRARRPARRAPTPQAATSAAGIGRARSAGSRRSRAIASAALTCRSAATASVTPASIRMLPIAGIGSGAAPAPKICASDVDCAAIEPGELQRRCTMQPDREAEQQARSPPRSAISRKNGRAGSTASASGAIIGATTRVKAIGAAEPDARRDQLLAEAGQQRHDRADAHEDQDQPPRGPASLRSSSCGEPSIMPGQPEHRRPRPRADLLEAEHRVADALGAEHGVQEAPALGRGDDAPGSGPARRRRRSSRRPSWRGG